MRGLHRMTTDQELHQFVELWSQLQGIELQQQEDEVAWNQRLVLCKVGIQHPVHRSILRNGLEQHLEDQGRTQVSLLHLSLAPTEIANGGPNYQTRCNIPDVKKQLKLDHEHHQA